jgi:hypothetical protein
MLLQVKEERWKRASELLLRLRLRNPPSPPVEMKKLRWVWVGGLDFRRSLGVMWKARAEIYRLGKTRRRIERRL